MHQKQLKEYNIEQLDEPLKFNYCLDPKQKEEPYDEKTFKCKNFLHKNGQRKLLLGELYFYLNFLQPGKKQLCVYVGAAPGKHIQLFLNLFPDLNFELYDPRDFSIKESERVKIFQRFFEDKDCEQYKNKDILFISDIRSVEEYAKAKDQQVVEDDMNFQGRWVKMIAPKAFSLKFKLNWNKKEQKYFGGDIFIQPWTSSQSTETRLIGTSTRMKTYDNKKYEQQCYYYNKNLRCQIYEKTPGYYYPKIYDCCHDCMCECNLINDYIQKKFTNLTFQQIIFQLQRYLIIKEKINQVVKDINYKEWKATVDPNRQKK